MNQIKKENIVFMALENARRENNFHDCDVIQNAITQLEQAKTDSEIIEALEYLDVSICYRAGVAGSRNYVEEYKGAQGYCTSCGNVEFQTTTHCKDCSKKITSFV